MTALTLAERGALTMAENMPTVTGGSSGGLALMGEFVQTLDHVERFVQTLVDTPFVPESHWPLPVGVRANEMPNRSARMRHATETEENWRIRRQIACASATGAVLTGLPLGLDPLIALANVYLVKGRPGLYTKLKVALAQARGHQVWDVELSDEVATVAGRRRGTDTVVEITTTIEQARAAKWTENEAYQKTPRDMLWSRSASRVLDRVAADVLYGIASIEDLLVDDDPSPVRAADAPAGEPAVPGRGSARLRELVQQPMPDEQPGETGYVAPPINEQPQNAVDAVTEPQLRKLGAVFTDLGVKGSGERAERLRIAGEVVGRPLTTSRDLTKREAQMLIDTLEGAGAEERRRLGLAPDPQPHAEPGSPPLPGEEDPPADPWGINDPTGDADPDTDELAVPGDES